LGGAAEDTQTSPTPESSCDYGKRKEEEHGRIEMDDQLMLWIMVLCGPTTRTRAAAAPVTSCDRVVSSSSFIVATYYY
jgi:hypothetical protein